MIHMTSPFVSLYIAIQIEKLKKRMQNCYTFLQKKSLKRIRLFFSLGSFVDDDVVKADLTVFNLMNHN